MTSIMVERAGPGTDRPLWTLRRVAGWGAASFAAIFIAGVVMGLLAAALDRGTGAHLWRDRILATVPVVVIAIMGGIAVLALRRSWPRRPGPDAGEWEHRAFARARRTATVWVVAVGALLLAGIAVPVAVWAGTGTVAGAVLLALGIGAGVAGLAWGTVRYMQVIDDHERRANLYCGYAGLTTYMVLFFAQLLARKVTDLPRMDDAIFGITALVATATFCVVRFR